MTPLCQYLKLLVIHHICQARNAALRLQLQRKQLKLVNVQGNDVETMRKCQQRASAMMRDKVWAGEDVILAAADYLQRDIHVFIAAEQASPLVYSAGVTVLPPVRIAFTEPGHYQAVLDMDITRVSGGQYLN
jgi:hypothetical protein